MSLSGIIIKLILYRPVITRMRIGFATGSLVKIISVVITLNKTDKKEAFILATYIKTISLVPRNPF